MRTLSARSLPQTTVGLIFKALWVTGVRTVNAQTHAQGAARTLASVIAAIKRADSKWLRAMRLHDAARIVAPYNNDAIFSTADGASIRGRDSIVTMYRTRLRRMVRILGGGIVMLQHLLNFLRDRETYTSPVNAI